MAEGTPRTSPKNKLESVVAAFTDHTIDKYSLLEKVLEHSYFFEVLESDWANSGKDKEDFLIAVKPNLAMMLRRSDVGTYTDPFLVIHLLRLLLQRGYTNLAVVESQNLYSNWFENRAVIQIAARSGYFDESTLALYQNETSHPVRVKGLGIDADIPLVDLSLEMESYDVGPPVGKILLGKTWINADFRINFPKMKTHFYSYYTMAIKNIYGCLPLQDKVLHYHCKKNVGLWTAHLIKALPIHFSIIDGYTAADGWAGVKMKAVCTKPHTIIAGSDVMAVDHFGAQLMKVKPERSPLYAKVSQLLPLKPYKVVGNTSPFDSWRNTLYFFVLFCKVIEKNANIMDWMGSLSTGGYDSCFPHKKDYKSLLKKFFYYITLPVSLLIDIGIVRLRIREKLFMRRIRKHKDKMPVIANASFLLQQLTLLGPEDLENLSALTDQCQGEVVHSGHYIFDKEQEFSFPSRMSTTNLAVIQILNYLYYCNLDRSQFRKEVRILLDLYPGMFGKDRRYSWCYG